ncbi:Hypothetical predicted protein [Octopus vulgaris]|uniref:Outer dense fiber protein 2 n=1 Tax=Octopus vulgaris TaxID=6645 RepID=A0AA36BQ23_OCTVU|nr:Hypothetical predicted protein [Octopus vulgaris]
MVTPIHPTYILAIIPPSHCLSLPLYYSPREHLSLLSQRKQTTLQRVKLEKTGGVPELFVVMMIEKSRKYTSPTQITTMRRSTPVPLHERSRSMKLSEMSRQFDSGNFRNRRLKSKKPVFTQLRAPFIPPPAKTSKGSKYITQIVKDTNSDGSDEDGKIQNQIQNYEKKIDDLMFEVGSLKNQVDLQKALHDIEKNGSMLETRRKMMEEHADQLKTICGELDASSNENRVLRQNLNQLKEVAEEKKAQCEKLCSEKDKLTRKLIEVELDGQAAGKLVSEMNLAIGKLVEEIKPTPTQSDTAYKFSRQKDALLNKLSTFESTNQTLQKMLQDRHSEEIGLQRVAEQNRLLFQKLQGVEKEKEKMILTQFTQDRTISDLETTVSEQKEEVNSLKRLQKSVEQTRGHLQRQLRTKEADCNRMSVQIQTLEKQLAEAVMDNKRLQRQMSTVRDQSDKDKGYLKKATRLLKQKASYTEDTVEHLNSELVNKEKELTDASTQLDVYRTRLEQIGQEKSSAFAECSKLKQEMEDLQNKIHLYEDNSTETSRMSAMLEEKTLECQNKCQENEKLMSIQEELTSKLTEAETNVSHLQTKLTQAEEIIEEYKGRMDISRSEANNTLSLLEEQQKQNSRIQREGEDELDKVKKRLHQRLLELEPLPEMLKTTELKVQDFEQQLHLSERKSTENIKLIAELTSKLEHVNEMLEEAKQMNHEYVEENRSLRNKADTLERKFLEVTEQNRELMTTISKREETIRLNNVRLEEKTQETMSLTHQLENALQDLKQQSSSFHERVISKERLSQQKILDLECQVNQVKTEVNRVKREKDENDRRCNSRLHDLKDRLEQSQSTNRSLQNYVQFLKTSYRNVYGDMTEPFLRPTLP